MSGSPWKRRLKNLLTALVSALLTLGLIEGVARLLPVRVAPSVYEYDPDTYFTLKRGYRHTFSVQVEENEVVEIPFASSPQGLRDRTFGPKEPGEYRVAMLGDSFTGGQGLRQDQTISHHIEHALAGRTPHATLTVMNCGVGGYAPWQERIFLHKRVFPLDPDMVVLQLYPGNDLAGCLEEDGKFLRAYNSRWAETLREWKAYESLPNRIERSCARVSRAYALLLDRMDRPYLVSSVVRAFGIGKRWKLDALPTNAPHPEFLEPELAVAYPLLEEAWHRLEQSVLGIRDDCRKRGIEFAVYAIPHIKVVDTAAWEALTPQTADSYVRSKSMDRIKTICEENGIPYLDVYRAIMSHAQATGLYYGFDWHLNPAGAEFVGRFVASELLAAVCDSDSMAGVE